MGLTATLDGTITLVIRDDAGYGRMDADWGGVESTLRTIKQGLYGVPRLLAVDRSELRRLYLPIVLRGDDVDDVADQLDEINTALAKSTTLVVADGTATKSITFRTLPSPSAECPTQRMFARGLLLPVLSINVEPYAYGDEVTLINAATALPAQIDLSAMTGSYETPLEVSFALSDMTQIICGLLEEEYASWTGWLVDANTLSWDSGGAAVDGNAAGGMAWKVTGGVRAGAAINVTGFPRGEYALWIRARMTAGSADLWSSSIGSSRAVTVSETAYAWHDLGRLICPTRHTYGAGTATTSVFMNLTSTNDGWIDRIAFVRAAAGYLAYNGDACDSFAHDGEHAYVDGRTDYESVRGSALYAKRGKLCAIAETDGASGASISPTVVVKATSRHGLWRA